MTRLGVVRAAHFIRSLLAGEEIDRLTCNLDRVLGQDECIL
jgi:hypothetical protein